MHIQHDEDERRNADTQAKDVDERGDFVSPEYAEGDGEETS